ncbi:MAG TPA: DUF4012 domain-containing protein [Dehalococcoidia bacterium]
MTSHGVRALPRFARLRPALCTIVLWALPLLVALLALFAVVVRDALAAGRELQTAEHQVGGVLHGDLDPSARGQVRVAGATLDNAAGRLQRDRWLLAPAIPLLRALGWLPLVGRPLSEAPDLLAAATNVASGGAELAHGLDPLLAETETTTDARSAPPAARLVAALDSATAALRQGNRDLQQALEERARLHPDAYHGPFRGLGDRLADFDANVPGVARQANALALLPAAARALLGFNGPRTYLVVGQDSAELRPTGGFIGSAGLITLQQGALVFQEYRSSYDFDAPNAAPLAAPMPLQQYLGTPVWSLRDANWSPDFPTAAQQLIAFVQRDLGISPDGVLAFDNDAVSGLLAALGPLSVPGFAQPLTAETWFDQTTQALITGPGSLLTQLQNANAAKGAGLSAVLKAALATVDRASGERQTGVLQALRAAARGGHLLLYTPEPATTAWTRAAGADGAILPLPAGDALAVVDANLSYTKIDPYIERSYTYEVWLRPDARAERAELRLTYHNTVTSQLAADPAKRLIGARWVPQDGRFEPAPGLFGDYVRLLLPASTALTAGAAGTAEPQIADSDGLRSAGLFLPLGPQEAQTLVFDLQPGFMPPAPGTYRLTVFKQPGVDHVTARVIVHLPPGRSAAVSQGGSVQGGAAVWDLALSATATIQLQLAGR